MSEFVVFHGSKDLFRYDVYIDGMFAGFLGICVRDWHFYPTNGAFSAEVLLVIANKLNEINNKAEECSKSIKVIPAIRKLDIDE